MKISKTKTVAILILASMLLVSSWAYAESTSKAKTLIIGQVLPLSGGAALWGQQSALMGKLACEMWNKAGGVTINGQKYIYDTITCDSGFTAKGGNACAQKLVYQDKVHFMNSFGSTVTNAVGEFTEAQKILTLGPFWSKVAENGDYTFRLISTPDQTDSAAIAFFRKKHPDAKRIAMLGLNDMAGVTSMELDKKIWLAEGCDIVFFDYYERDATEFYPIVTRMLATKPDIIQGLSPRPGQWGVIIKTINELGYDGIIAGLDDPKTDIETSGEFRAEGVYGYGGYTFYDPVLPTWSNYVDKICQEKTGKPLAFSPAGCWEAIACLHEALFRAQSLDPDVLVKTMKADDFCWYSLYGRAAFGGQKRVSIMVPTLIGQAQDGKYVQLEKVESEECRQRLSSCRGPLANYPDIFKSK